MFAAALPLLLSIALFAPMAAVAQQAPAREAAAPAIQPIPFRKDDDLGAMAFNVGLGLTIAIGAGVAVLVVLRRYLAGMQKAPGKRLRVIETVRLGPKSALFLVELDGRSLLIGQQGDTLAVLAHPAEQLKPPAPADHAA